MYFSVRQASLVSIVLIYYIKSNAPMYFVESNILYLTYFIASIVSIDITEFNLFHYIYYITLNPMYFIESNILQRAPSEACLRARLESNVFHRI